MTTHVAPRTERHRAGSIPRHWIYLLSRLVICGLLVAALGPLFWRPPNAFLYVLDVLFRTWVTFLGTVLAHEGTHGHLGHTKAQNFWWGRLALIPTMVPFTNFVKTHNLHHAHTNEPDTDPDHFMKPRFGSWELPFRALAMPHQWLFWLAKRGRIRTGDLIHLALNYVGILTVFGIILAFVGPERLISGVAPVLVLVSLLLWYPFAFKTHEGFSTGSAESRSHSYYGSFMYWFSFGLSMHREHHMEPWLAWIELHPFIQPAPAGSWRRFLPWRDIRPDAEAPRGRAPETHPAGAGAAPPAR